MDLGGAEAGSWPTELRELVSIPQIAACLEALDVHSLADFVEVVDVEEGHDAQLHAVVDALPSKPRRSKLLRNRAKMTLTDLLQRLSVFIEFDVDEDGFLSRVECMRMPLEKMQAKAGGIVADHFDEIDTDRDGRISFAELFTAAELAEGLAVLPSTSLRPVGPEHPAAAETIQLWIKAPGGAALRVPVENGLATTVAQIRSTAADAARLDVSRCRLIFAGKELEDRMSLADYNCETESELHLILRVEDEAPSVDREAEQQTAAMRAQLVGKKLADFNVSRKIGGKDIAAIGGGASQSISQSGVCSYVYLAQMRSGPPIQLALKVMLNYQEDMASSVALHHEFTAETALLSDPNRLPAHRHVMVVLGSFTDNAAALPSWNFEADIVNPRTLFVAMPYYPTDLKRMFKSTQQQGQVFGELRAVRIVSHLLLAVRHLKSHGIVHRDVKLDNVMVASPGTATEAAVLTDFGMCLDLTKNRISEFRVPMPYDGIRRGGAPIALAPEVTLPEPGPDVCLDYSKNDEWAVGMIAYELLSQGSEGPFADMEHPATYSDSSYREETISHSCRPLVSGLLRVAVADRLDATEGSRRAKRLETMLAEDAEPEQWELVSPPRRMSPSHEFIEHWAKTVAKVHRETGQGPEMEQLIKEKNEGNPAFAFLSDQSSMEGQYYIEYMARLSNQQRTAQSDAEGYTEADSGLQLIAAEEDEQEVPCAESRERVLRHDLVSRARSRSSATSRTADTRAHRRPTWRGGEVSSSCWSYRRHGRTPPPPRRMSPSHDVPPHRAPLTSYTYTVRNLHSVHWGPNTVSEGRRYESQHLNPWWDRLHQCVLTRMKWQRIKDIRETRDRELSAYQYSRVSRNGRFLPPSYVETDVLERLRLWNWKTMERIEEKRHRLREEERKRFQKVSRYVSAAHARNAAERLATPRCRPAPVDSGRAKMLKFSENVRKGRSTWAGQARLQSCADMLSQFPWSQAYRERVAECMQVPLATKCAGQRVEIDDGLMFFYPRPPSGFEITPTIVLLPTVQDMPSRPVHIFDKLTGAQLAARGFGRDKTTAADGQYIVVDKPTLDANRPRLQVETQQNPIALEKIMQALVKVDARIKASKQVSAVKNAARKVELRRFLEEQRAIFIREEQQTTSGTRQSPSETDSDEESGTNWFGRLESGIVQEIDMITRSEEYSGVQDSTPFPIANANKMSHIALVHEACNIDGQWGRKKFGVSPGARVQFEVACTAMHLPEKTRRDTHELTQKISFDPNRVRKGCRTQPDPVGLEKHKQSLVDLDAKIRSNCKIASRNNQDRRRELSMFLEQQSGADAADDSSSEQGVSEPDDDFLRLADGLAQEMAIIDRAEARATQLGQDLNSVAFWGLKKSDEEFAAQVGPSWIEAKKKGAKEWGFENEPIVGSDANRVPFPLRCVAVKLEDEGDGEPGQFEPVQVEQNVDPETFRPKHTSEEPLAFDLPEGQSAWKVAPEPTPLTEDELTRCETMFVRDCPDMFTFELPSQLVQLVPSRNTGSKCKATWRGATFEEGVGWAVVSAMTPLTEEDVSFANNWAENCLRGGSRRDLPEFDFDFPAGQSTAWELIVEDDAFDVITRDECTDAQRAVHVARAARHNLEKSAASRRVQLATRFNCDEPSAEFLTERLAPSETELPRAIEAHKVRRRAEKIAEQEQAHHQPQIERTDAQLEILERRRISLANRFNCSVPCVEFLTERLAPSDERLPAIIEAHRIKRLEEKAAEAAAIGQLIERAVASTHVPPAKLAKFFERKGRKPPDAFLKSNWPIHEVAFELAAARKQPYERVQAELASLPEGVPPTGPVDVKSWTSSQLVAWLRDVMNLESVAEKTMAEGGVDGAAGLLMDKDDWKELGASGVQASKIMSQLHKLG